MIAERNPYSTSPSWDDETRKAFQSMPQYGGYCVALDWVAPKDIPAQEEAWRAWCKGTPRHLWPLWLKGWPDRKRLKGLA